MFVVWFGFVVYISTTSVSLNTHFLLWEKFLPAPKLMNLLAISVLGERYKGL